MRLRFAAEFGLAPQDVGKTPFIWWQRWLAWEQAKGTQEAYQHRHNYRDKHGAENWAEWQTKYSELYRRLKWALDPDDLDNG